MFGFGAANPVSNPTSYASPASQTTGVKSYDYVIVGGGTAGCVLASRLTEDPNVSVLVLEAGYSHVGLLRSTAPVLFKYLLRSKYDWQYNTTPQPNVMSREIYWPRGKLLGGCSSINAMMYSHPSFEDCDNWAKEFGCEGWSYEEMRHYFKKAAKFTPNPERPAIDLANHGDSGLWQVGQNFLSAVGEKGFLRAAQELGFPYTPDMNTPKGVLGATRFMTFIDPKGQRSSTAAAYLTPEVLSRPNLTVAIQAPVTRILLKNVAGGSGEPIAIGAEIQQKKGAPLYKVHAHREVLLCNGAVNTPQTLKLSGIGPAPELVQFDIPVVVDSPHVGENLLDHFCSTPVLAPMKPGNSLNHLVNPLKAIPPLMQWLTTGKGPLTFNVGEVAMFIRAADEAKRFGYKTVPKDYASGKNSPDLEFIATPICFLMNGDELPPPGYDPMTFAPIHLRPQSKGRVLLKSTSPFDAPLIDPRYWSDPEDNDRKVLVTGVRIALEMLHSKAYEPFIEKIAPSSDINSYYWPYCDPDWKNIPDEKLLAFIGRKAFTLYHPVSSCRMRPSIEDGVVGADLKVHGVRGLRVCDASVFADQISDHPTCMVVATAEKCADLIKEEHKSSRGAVIGGHARQSRL